MKQVVNDIEIPVYRGFGVPGTYSILVSNCEWAFFAYQLRGMGMEYDGNFDSFMVDDHDELLEESPPIRISDLRAAIEKAKVMGVFQGIRVFEEIPTIDGVITTPIRELMCGCGVLVTAFDYPLVVTRSAIGMDERVEGLQPTYVVTTPIDAYTLSISDEVTEELKLKWLLSIDQEFLFSIPAFSPPDLSSIIK